MKKNLIMSLVVAGAMGLMLTGCGDKPEKVTVEVQESIEATVETQPTETAQPTVEADAEDKPLADVEPTQGVESQPTESTETTAEATTESATEVVEVEVPQQEVDYLAENGITITPYDSVTSMTVADYNSDNLHERNVDITVETVASNEEGYSDTIFKAVWDTSKDINFSTHYSIYDRYTGYDLTFTSEDANFESEGGTYKEVCIVEVDGKQYDCSYTFDWNTSAGTTYVATITVHHPNDYDGVVFSAGQGTASLLEFEGTLDISTQRKLADYPELIEGHYFFTATNN